MDYRKVEDLGKYQHPYAFEYDVVFRGWIASMLCERVLDSFEGSPLVAHIVRQDTYFDYMPEDEQRELRKAFLKEMNRARLVLAPFNEPGVIRRRFWEALSMGRIPVLIDDRVELPFSDEIDWSSICLHVPEADVGVLPEILERFLSSNADDTLRYRGRIARQTWCNFFKEGHEDSSRHPSV